MVQNIHKYLFPTLLLGFVICPSWGQGVNPDTFVWPGDVNNNGLVDHVDVLYLGGAIGLQGPGRETITTFWDGYPSPQDWGMGFSNPADISFADCDGSGDVNPDDLIAIEENYDLGHDSLFANYFDPSPNTGVADLRFGDLNAPLAPGQILEIPIILNGGEMAVDDFYGIAFSILIDTQYVSPGMEMTFNGWLDTGDPILEFQRLHGSLVRYDVSLSRLYQTAINGTGKIGTLHIVIEGDLPSFTAGEEILDFGEIYLVDQVLRRTEVTGHPLMADFINSDNGPADSVSPLKIHPNPTKDGICRISGLDDAPVERATLYDLLGHRMEIPINNGDLQLSHLPKGTYFLEIIDHEGVRHVEKLLITP